ncbi:DUF2442 domain-containing protein [Ureibacillus chungkukjangi]|uniref:DUF2442 domain-containing protein n=1 Tax=Ureibacillus chungkukjangi TaxID=1202712 RepID=UPI00203C2A5E|nr:DUF2442 domain-containing protein [Ureibacillus chungkukjangi]MCM3390247.1 DUF2442 domain-containing protein [Ureibacillus chungkukjangi]
MRIRSFYATKTFKLIMEFENMEYRILDMKQFLTHDQGLLKQLRDDVNLFLSAELDDVAGTVRFSNNVDFDNMVLHESSLNLDDILK